MEQPPIGVTVGVLVMVGVGVIVGVFVIVGVLVAVGVSVGVGVMVGVFVMVGVGVMVGVFEGVGGAEGTISMPLMAGFSTLGMKVITSCPLVTCTMSLLIRARKRPPDSAYTSMLLKRVPFAFTEKTLWPGP